MSDRPARLPSLALRLVILGLAVAVVAVLLTRFGAIPFRPGLLGVAGGMLVVAAGTVLGLLGMALAAVGRGRGGFGTALAATVLGVMTISFPAYNAVIGASVPPIHDITTDTENPPQFDAIVPLRGEDANPLDRADETLAARQLEAYPWLETLVVPNPPGEVFEAALAAADAQDWVVADAVAPDGAEAGRIEATDTTLLFGFEDDVVVRIQGDGPGRTIVDMRSVSRVGESDLGANARRIKTYLDDLKARL